MDTLENRDNDFIEKLKKKPYVLAYFLLAVIAWFGFYIRTRNLPLLKDAVTGKFIPLALDPYVFLRYVQYIVENGSLMAVDTMRFYPFGFSGMSEFKLLTYTIAYSYKLLSVFSPSITIEYVHVMYPPVAFIIGIVCFFFLLKKVFNWKVGLLGSAFLTVLPAYLYRTLAGFSDKEALAMVFMFLGLLLFLNMFMEKKFKKAVIYSVLAGIVIAMLWLTWGGVGFALLTIGAFVVIMVLLGRFSKNNLYLYTIFLLTFVIVMRIFFPERTAVLTLLFSTTSGFLFLGLFLGWLDFALFKKDLLKIKHFFSKVPLPLPFVTFGIILISAVLLGSIVYGTDFLTSFVNNVVMTLVQPQNFDRWSLTVAESHQPYFVDWIGQFTWMFLSFMFVGAVALFYEIFKGIGKHVYGLSFGFGLAIIAFVMSRYSEGSPIFNGTSQIAVIFHLGSLVVFLLYFVYVIYDLYNNDKDNFKELSRINYGYMLILLFFFFTLVGGRSAIRLLFVLAPGAAMMAGYGIYWLGEYSYKKIKNIQVAYGVIAVLAIIFIFMFYTFSNTVIVQAQYTGPSYNQQWQVGMDWVRTNTAEDSVFAHWWDYGYWVQTGGERTTISDGGNALGGVNHFVGRHLLTGQNETEALEFLASREVSHVLMISDEIGKYGAFSSIGADANYDRRSWISTFNLDLSQTQETRNGTSFVYTGGTPFDDDQIYQDQYFPAGSAGIGGFIIPTVLDENGTLIGFEQPTAAISSGGMVYYAPVRCVFYNGEEVIFNEDEEAIEGCLMIVPKVSGGEMNVVGSAFWLSRDVWNTVFTHLYLFGEDWEYFEEVYSDDQSVPLMTYDGRIVGPIKIWEVTYPEDLTIPEEYYGTVVPEEVRAV